MIKFKSLIGAIYKIFLLMLWTALCIWLLATPIWLGIWVSVETGNPWFCIISFVGALLCPFIIGLYIKVFCKIVEWLDRGLDDEEN